MAATFCLQGPDLVLAPHESFPAWQRLSVFIKLSSTEICKRKYWRYGRDFSSFVCPEDWPNHEPGPYTVRSTVLSTGTAMKE